MRPHRTEVSPTPEKTTQEATDRASDQVTNVFTDLKLNAVTQELDITHTASKVATVLNTISMEELVKYHHQSLVSPPKNAIYSILLAQASRRTTHIFRHE